MTYPLTRTPIVYPGELPDDDAAWDVGPKRFWLGQPGQMIEIPSVAADGSYTAPSSRGESENGLASGASSVKRRRFSSYRWTLQWPRLAPSERAILDGFYRDAFGPGPFVFVAPEDRNRIPYPASMCGSLLGVVEGWTPGSGSLAYTTAVQAPIQPCGVLAWTGASANGYAWPVGPTITDPDVSFGAPYLPAMPVSWSFWARAASGTVDVRPVLRGLDTIGGTIAAVNGTTVTVGTSWALLEVHVAPGVLTTSAYLKPLVQNITGAAVRLSCPMLEYRDFRSDGFFPGTGVPRVSFAPDGRQQRAFDAHLNEQSPQITLVDAITGRA